MGKIGKIVIDYSKEVYRAGEVVKGVWEVEVTEAVTIKGITARLCGEAFVKWTEPTFNRRDHADDEFIGKEFYTLQKKELHEEGELPVGIHKYPFSFEFPNDKMPSSFEGSLGVIRYWLDINIKRPFPWSDVYRYKGLTFLDEVEVNYQTFAKPYSGTASKMLSKLLGIGNAGEVKLTAQIHRRAFCPGEKIVITAKATNNSSKDLGELKAQLLQKVRYLGNGKFRYVESCVNSLKGNIKLLPGKNASWNGQQLSIDAIPPSTRIRSSHCLLVSYCVRVFVDIPKLKGGDLGIRFPITIGTIPQGYKKPFQVASNADRSSVLDLSNAITYTKCSRGYCNLNETVSGNMVNMDYTPMCAYVPNYRYVKPTSPQQTQTKLGPQPVPQKQTQRAKPTSQPVPQKQTQQTKPGPQPVPQKQTQRAKPTSQPVPQKQTQRANSTPPPASPNQTQQAKPGPQPAPQKQIQQAKSTPPPVSSNQTQQARPGSQPASPNLTQHTISHQLPQGNVHTTETRTGAVSANRTLPITTTAAVPGDSVLAGAAAQKVITPSAPPISQFSEGEVDNDAFPSDDALPSYDDLFGPGEEDNVSEDEELVEKGYFMFMRFPKDKKQEFMKVMKENKLSLNKFNGRLSAVQAKELSHKGAWPENAILAILYFRSKEMACDWLRSAPEVSNEHWLGSCDIILIQSIERFQETHQVLVFSVSRRGPNFNMEDFEKLKEINNTHLKPARKAFGSVTISQRNMDIDVLRGSWETSADLLATIMIWTRAVDIRDYKKTVDAEIYKEYERYVATLYQNLYMLVAKLEDLNVYYEDDEE